MARTDEDRKFDWGTGRELERKDAEIARLREAIRIALLHAPNIRLAPERRHTIRVLEEALGLPPKVRAWLPMNSNSEFRTARAG